MWQSGRSECFVERRAALNNAKRYVATMGADKSLPRANSRYIFFYGENISFDASLVIYIYKQY